MVYKGKSLNRMDDLGVPLFQETRKWLLEGPKRLSGWPYWQPALESTSGDQQVCGCTDLSVCPPILGLFDFGHLHYHPAPGDLVHGTGAA